MVSPAEYDWTPSALLPGLYVAALVGLLVFLLARYFDPVPPRVRLWGAGLCLVLFGPVLLGGRVLLPVDLLRSDYPFRNLPASQPGGYALQVDLVYEIAAHQFQIRRALARGELPLWNDRVGAGMPLLADPQAQVLQPLTVLALPFPVAQAAGVTAALRFALAFLFFFLLLRRTELGLVPALFGAVAYSLGGALLLWLGWPLANATAWLPAVVYAELRCLAGGRRRDVLLLAACAFGLLTGGQPEVVLYGLLVAASALLLAAPELRLRWAHLLFAWLAAVAFASPALILAGQYLPHTQRAAILEAVYGGRSPLPALWSVVEDPARRAEWQERALARSTSLLAPRAFGDQESYTGESNLIEDGAGFVSTGALVLALVVATTRQRTPLERWLLLLLAAAFCLLLQPPGFDVLTYHTPGVGFTAAHKHRRLLLLVAFAVAGLAACALARIERDGVTRRKVLSLAAVLGAGLVLAYLRARGLEHWGWLTLQLSSLALPVALLLCRPQNAALGFLLGSALELLFFHLPANVPNAEHLAFPATPGIEVLRTRTESWRMVPMGRGFRANLPAALGLADVRVSNASEPAEYSRATKPLRQPAQTPVFSAVQHPLYDLLGVKWVVVPPGIELPLERVYDGEDLAVYRRPSALPRLFLPRAAEVGEEGRWQQWLMSNEDFAARAWVVGKPGEPRSWTADERPAELRIETLGITRIEAVADLPEPRLLASGIFQDGGWRLFVDGEERTTVRTNGPFVGGWLPAGSHHITVRYQPRGLAAGLALAASTALLILAWLALSPSGVSSWLNQE